MTTIDGLTFDEVWDRRVVGDLDVLQVPYIDRDSFITNKKASGRAKDLGDIFELEAD